MTRTLATALLAAALAATTACSSGHRAAGPSPAPAPSTTASLAGTPTASATPSPPSCFDTAESTLEMNDCAARDERDAERLLAAVLAAVRKKLDPAGRATLDRTQRAWRAYRDTFCPTFRAGGSIDTLNELGCYAGLEMDRARDVCDWYSPNATEDRPAICAKVDR